tara:strand:+ start:11182 stop:11826 length:645 start_codon:yes stop_codon:yes gene_type:complete
MDIQSIRKIIFPAVSDAVSKLEEENHKIKITMIREIFNEAINGALNISHTNNASIKAMFSGRGRAWAKVDVDNNNPVWLQIKDALTIESRVVNNNSEMFELSSGMLDLFESLGIAWMRYGSTSKGYTNFHLRVWGSKLEKHIKVYVSNQDIEKNFIQNLEGVPHKLNLECGNFLINEINKKEKIDIDITPEELDCFGIQTLEDVLGEQLENESR